MTEATLANHTITVARAGSQYSYPGPADWFTGTVRVDPLRFYATQPYAQVATVYVYARDAHPEGLGVNRLADLRRLKVCVLRGFPLEEDMVDARQVDDQSTSLEQLFGKVQQGRCDAALEREDVVDHLAQGQASLARWYGEALATGLTVADVEAWPARMEAVGTSRRAEPSLASRRPSQLAK